MKFDNLRFETFDKAVKFFSLALHREDRNPSHYELSLNSIVLEDSIPADFEETAAVLTGLYGNFWIIRFGYQHRQPDDMYDANVDLLGDSALSDEVARTLFHCVQVGFVPIELLEQVCLLREYPSARRRYNAVTEKFEDVLLKTNKLANLLIP